MRVHVYVYVCVCVCVHLCMVARFWITCVRVHVCVTLARERKQVLARARMFFLGLSLPRSGGLSVSFCLSLSLTLSHTHNRACSRASVKDTRARARTHMNNGASKTEGRRQEGRRGRAGERDIYERESRGGRHVCVQGVRKRGR